MCQGGVNTQSIPIPTDPEGVDGSGVASFFEHEWGEDPNHHDFEWDLESDPYYMNSYSSRKLKNLCGYSGPNRSIYRNYNG